jgi:hypothetical protein
MMNTRFKTRMTSGALLLRRAVALVAITCAAFAANVQAQTPGGTQIQNRASATYSDGTTSYSTVSNQVTVTVANVSGLAITPDAGTNPTVVSGQTSVDFTFTVTNTSNYATQVRFLQSGASIALTGSATVQAAVIDLTNNGLDGTDTDIKGNSGGDVLSAAIARNASITVIVRVDVSAAAAAGSTINVRLGDASGGGPTFDNQTANTSAAEVRTSSGASAPVNGESEARGDISATVQADAQLRLSINAPAGPVALGSNITYTWQLDNTGQRAVNSQTLAGAPAGSNTGVFVIAPVPVGTSFISITPPAGVTVLYSTSSLANDPLSALTVWTTTPPAPLSSVTRVAYNTGATLATGASVTNMQMVVQISSTINASTPIYEIGDAFGRNNVNSPITDQSGDNTPNKGDGNANFNEPRLGVDAATATQGFQVPTLLTQVGNVLVGPSGQPAAVGPTDNNDDYTNRSSSVGIAGVAFGGATTAAATIDFINTVRNTGNANDVYTLTAPTVPAGFTVQISTDGGTTFTNVTSGGSTTLALNFGQQANITVRVTVPLGSAILNGFNTVIRARSANTNTSFNDTIDRLYTGFLRLQKSFVIINATGVGAATDAVPGADIEYTITYSNLSSSGGTNNVTLTASSIVISEDGNAAPNNWAANTTQVTSPAPSDSTGGAITDGVTNGAVTATSTFLKDSVTSLAPGASGTFKFRRRIN